VQGLRKVGTVTEVIRPDQGASSRGKLGEDLVWFVKRGKTIGWGAGDKVSWKGDFEEEKITKGKGG